MGAIESIIGLHLAEQLNPSYGISLKDCGDLRMTCNVTGFWLLWLWISKK